MKVCYITPYPLRKISGVTRVVTQISKGLKKRDIENFVISGRLVDEIEKDPDVDAVEIDVSKITHLRDTYLAIKTAFILIRRKDDYDIIHLQSPHMQPMVCAIIGKVLRKPVITTIHGKFPKSKSLIRGAYFSGTLKGTFAFSNKITFVDKKSPKHYKITSGEVIENGIDTQFFSPDARLRRKTREKLNLNEDDIVYLFLGRLVAHKGIFDLLQAFSDIISNNNTDARLLIIGSGDVQKVSEKITELKMEESVTILGKVDEVRDYYCAADIFVLYTSPLEGLPIALLEASSCSLSIITTRVSGIPDVITDGDNGLMIEYGDKDGLINSLKLVGEDPALRKRLGRKAREKILEFYDIEQTTKRYISLYERTLREFRY